jgi:beta-fructofuranosidase
MLPWLHYRPAAGWMNDPNGLVHRRGRHHMFYQYNPNGIAFTNQHWGHASSTDLLRWTEHEVALRPGPHGYDTEACFSGCAVPHASGVSFLYTGVGPGGELPCLAHADDEDLGALRKDSMNPVVPAPPDDDVTAFRDHTVWRDGTRWWQLVGGGRAGLGGVLFAYSSADLLTWTYHGVFASAADTGVPGVVWECPDLIWSGDRAALIVSVIYADPPGRRPEVWWMTGRAEAGRLGLDAAAPCDLGDRLYAPQSYPLPDGRRIQFGWIRTHLDPTQRDASVLGAMSLPREVSIRDGRVHLTPAAELAGLRRTVLRTTADGATTAIGLGGGQVAGELVLDAQAAAGVDHIVLRGYDGAHAAAEMTVDMSGFAAASGELRLFWDAGIVEAFRGGLAGTWTDMRLRETVELRVHRPTPLRGDVAVWTLDRAGRASTLATTQRSPAQRE